jgi:predicted DNA binding CopG/RHH family protein
MSYQKLISFLPSQLYEFALQDEDTKQDIINQSLDAEEIMDLAHLNYQLSQESSTKKKITMALPERTLQGLKLRAAQYGLPYQTFINSILHQYITGTLQTGK